MKLLSALFCLTVFNLSVSAQSMTSANNFADSLERELELGKTEFIDERFPVEKILNQVLFEDETNEELSKFNRMFSSGFSAKFNYGKLITDQLNDNTFYNFIESYVNQQTKKTHVVFRLFSIDAGLNYHDYELDFNEVKNYWEIANVYVYLSGEEITRTFKSIYTPMVLPMLKNKHEGAKNDVEILEKISAIRLQYKNGEFEEAYRACKSIPEFYQSKKYFRIMCLQIAEHIGEKAYIAEAKKILDAFPSEKHTVLVSIDYHYMKKDYVKALETINTLDSLVGKDNLLDFLRANTHYEMGNLSQATVLYENTINNYPYFQEAYDMLIDICISEGDMAYAVEVISAMQYNMEYDKEELVAQVRELYPKLAKNRKFKSWAKK